MEQMTLSPEVRAEMAKARFMEGYGCAQAVLMTFSDVTGFDADVAVRMASSFGGGMGRMREVCGAVSGALMVLGVAAGYADPADTAAKSAHYARVREFADRFKARSGAGSIVCREILAGRGVPNEAGGEAEARTDAYYQKRPCGELCAIAASVLQEMLDEGK